MANSAQARKRARQAEKRRNHNVALRSRFRTAMKLVLKAVKSGDKAHAEGAYQSAVPTIDGMVTKGLIHRNKAARHKTRLHKHVQALG